MGFSGIGPGSLILILIIVVLLFGTKRLRNIGGDLGSALKNFKKAVKDGEESEEEQPKEKLESKSTIIEGEATTKDKSKT
ncbi:MAG: twin-arginine translocase TatA/TatE family subunit [Gammaproteobacteria bacterium]|jgi:sec-independent protein translocase protein TatA